MKRMIYLLLLSPLFLAGAGAVAQDEIVGPAPVEQLGGDFDGPAAPGDELSADVCASSTTLDGENSADEEELEERLVEDDVPGDAAASDPGGESLWRSVVREAERLFLQATRSFEQGNHEESAALYHESLATLGSAPLDATTGYALKEDFRKLFLRLGGTAQATGDPVARNGPPGYAIPLDAGNDLVKKYLKIYAEGSGREAITRALERSGRYREMVIRILGEFGLPRELVYLPVVESFYDNNDLSRAGALGIWQLMPHRARHLGLKVNYWIDERKDPEKATRAAARYLKELYLMFDDWHLALAAYNRGEYGLARDLRSSRATNLEEISRRRAVPRETEYFVPQFIACVLIGDRYQDYGLSPRFEKPLQYDTVVVDKVIDLKIVAQCAGSTLAEIRELNPALKAWCTPYNYSRFELRLPPGSKQRFLESIAAVKDLNPSQGYIKYRVVKGDCLSTLARKFKTTVRTIREDNRINNPKVLRVDQVLLIRPGRGYVE